MFFSLFCACSWCAFQQSCLSKSSGLNENASQHVPLTGCSLMCWSLESSEEPKRTWVRHSFADQRLTCSWGHFWLAALGMEVLHVSAWSESLGDTQDPIQYFCYLSCLSLSPDLKYLLLILYFSSLISLSGSLPSLFISHLERGWCLWTLMGYLKPMEYNSQKLV